jgi:hypothetical protein
MATTRSRWQTRTPGWCRLRNTRRAGCCPVGPTWMKVPACFGRREGKGGRAATAFIWGHAPLGAGGVASEMDLDRIMLASAAVPGATRVQRLLPSRASCATALRATVSDRQCGGTLAFGRLTKGRNSRFTTSLATRSADVRVEHRYQSGL